MANIYAALNYAEHRYGPTLMSGGMGIGSGHGYAAGGLITEPILGVGRSGRAYSFGEAGVERVTPGSGHPREGPLLHIGEVHVRETADMDILAQKLSFAIVRSGLG